MPDRNSGISNPSTSSSLIFRVRARDLNAWRQLCQLYGPLVYGWARKRGLQDCDAADVMQEVFWAISNNIDGFRSDRPSDSFRGWLWTITRNEISRSHNRRANLPQAAGGTDAHQKLEGVADNLDQSDESHANLRDSGLVHRGMELIRDEFEERTWQAFWRAVVGGQPASEIARDLEMTPGAVRQAKYRVLCRLRDVLQDR